MRCGGQPMFIRPLIVLSVSVALIGTPVALSAQPVSPADARAIAKDAYIYAFAMLENYQTLYSQAVDKNDNKYVGGFNVYRHYSEPFAPDNHDMCRRTMTRLTLGLGSIYARSQSWSAYPPSPKTATT